MLKFSMYESHLPQPRCAARDPMFVTPCFLGNNKPTSSILNSENSHNLPRTSSSTEASFCPSKSSDITTLHMYTPLSPQCTFPILRSASEGQKKGNYYFFLARMFLPPPGHCQKCTQIYPHNFNFSNSAAYMDNSDTVWTILQRITLVMNGSDRISQEMSYKVHFLFLLNEERGGERC